MSNKLDRNIEIVYEGWLTKSPPTSRIWRARWRKRWFILRHSGELPGQYYLCYYTDKNCRKLKGQIDLDQCEQVDAGLKFENRKQKYQFMFNIKIPKRTYYLAAESEDEMNKWVDYICHVCGLKQFLSDDLTTEYEGDDISQAATGITNLTDCTPPTTPSTIISGPYISISECISGKPVNTADELERLMRNRYKFERNPLPDLITGTNTPPPSPGSESVFTDDESPRKPEKPSVNWQTFPKPSDVSDDEGVKATLKANRRFTRVFSSADIDAPPRPPKPAYLAADDFEGKDEYQNQVKNTSLRAEISDAANKVYTNASPTKRVTGTVFRYDFPLGEYPSGEGNIIPDSPCSTTSSTTSITLVYSNLPSPSTPIVATPPVVNRELKPGRRSSETSEISPAMASPAFPPNVNRKLKPAQLNKIVEDGKNKDKTNVSLALCSPPIGGSLNRRSYQRSSSHISAPSSNSSESFANTFHLRTTSFDDKFCEPTIISMHFRQASAPTSKRNDEIQYLDLDLQSSDGESSEQSFAAKLSSKLVNKTSHYSTIPATATVYKTVDFLKTEAFNRTRIEFEEERHKLCLLAEST